LIEISGKNKNKILQINTITNNFILLLIIKQALGIDFLAKFILRIIASRLLTAILNIVAVVHAWHNVIEKTSYKSNRVYYQIIQTLLNNNILLIINNNLITRATRTISVD